MTILIRPSKNHHCFWAVVIGILLALAGTNGDRVGLENAVSQKAADESIVLDDTKDKRKAVTQLRHDNSNVDDTNNRNVAHRILDNEGGDGDGEDGDGGEDGGDGDGGEDGGDGDGDGDGEGNEDGGDGETEEGGDGDGGDGDTEEEGTKDEVMVMVGRKEVMATERMVMVARMEEMEMGTEANADGGGTVDGKNGKDTTKAETKANKDTTEKDNNADSETTAGAEEKGEGNVADEVDEGNGDEDNEGEDQGDKEEASKIDHDSDGGAETEPSEKGGETAEPGGTDDDDESGGKGMLGLGFVVLVGVAVYFKFVRKGGSSAAMPGSAHRPSTRSKYQEVATMEEDDGDDWGWGDNNDDVGDVELASSDASVDMPIPSPSGLALKQRSPSIEKKEVVSFGRHNNKIPSPRQQAKSPLQQSSSFQSSQAAPASAPSQYQVPTQRITQLGVPNLGTTTKKTPSRPKKQEDDIFASMGLSAQPKFQQPAKPAVRPPSSGGWGGALAVPSASTGEVWDDDGDLDDLLDD
ncbi:expressed unknown protein [Seminavis robusta]|uniref:Uncharacterized protein n=1 Tax=Seminavis robusta TaxID=568900 RepID=A0A9N8HFK3_9STRA|nr:expressed unknown protein [Seminavis robusta]|eukprot:Sro353_g124580.1 n/a (524) ;mRNA; r:49559-51293